MKVPSMPKATVPLKPLRALTVATAVVLLPAVTVKEIGEMASPKSGPAALVTMSWRVAKWTVLPDVPVIVIGARVLVNGAELEAVRVMFELPEPLMEEGAKLAVTPVGKPVAPRSTLPEKPFSALTNTDEFVVLPGATLRKAEEADSEKSGDLLVLILMVSAFAAVWWVESGVIDVA
jgi:hypothetical protein